MNNNVVHRNSYISKDNNISSKIYDDLCKNVKQCCYDTIKDNTDIKNVKDSKDVKDVKNNTINYEYIAVDGTNNSNKNRYIMLNMSYFDINNNIPIDLTYNTKKNRNKETQECTKYIESHIECFKNSNKVLVCDQKKILFFFN